MEIVMNKLTKNKLIKIYNEGKNLTDKPIYIDFYADWCGPCNTFGQLLEEVGSDYKDKINMYKVNIEEESDVTSMFGVRGIPYMVFISKDGELTSQMGGMDKRTLKYYFDGLISK
jgi:thioredoxin